MLLIKHYSTLSFRPFSSVSLSVNPYNYKSYFKNLHFLLYPPSESLQIFHCCVRIITNNQKVFKNFKPNNNAYMHIFSSLAAQS